MQEDLVELVATVCRELNLQQRGVHSFTACMDHAKNAVEIYLKRPRSENIVASIPVAGLLASKSPRKFADLVMECLESTLFEPDFII